MERIALHLTRPPSIDRRRRGIFLVSSSHIIIITRKGEHDVRVAQDTADPLKDLEARAGLNGSSDVRNGAKKRSHFVGLFGPQQNRTAT
jgi:hypothetical protein